MTDPMMIKKEGILHLGYSVYIWICFFYIYENFMSIFVMEELDRAGQLGNRMEYFYKKVFIFFLLSVLMIIIAHCAERFLRSNLFFPLANMLLSGASIVLMPWFFYVALGLSDDDTMILAANAFVAIRVLLFVDSIILLKKYFRAKTRNK